MPDTSTIKYFSDLALPATLLRAVQAVGYETPTPIQSRTIPPLLEGRDLLGHAPTGTGKTAAFALPILARLDMDAKGVQALILTPTRELAIQVAEAFTRYATHVKNFRVLPVYGGQDYTGQIRQLNRGVNVVVGTPGRIMDHMRRGTLKLDKLHTLVLDEADEMLRMGFIDDVEWILEQTPAERQMALFSATMPSVIKRIAARHLKRPVEISIEGRLSTADTIRQRYWQVSGLHKLDALTRILEAESFDAMLVFVRTRTATAELAEKLVARGFLAAAMNGDMPQKQREQMVDKLKRGSLDILVATDVVARGLDVDRISHVVNYDIPYDTEAYVHRIGRTGRAGRSGEAILFVTPRERGLLGAIERATRQKIEALELPTIDMVNNKRIADFKQRIGDTLATGELGYLQRLVEEFSREHDVPAERIAAALAKMSLGDQPLIINDKSRDTEQTRQQKNKEKRKAKGKERELQTRRDLELPRTDVTTAVVDRKSAPSPRREKSDVTTGSGNDAADRTHAARGQQPVEKSARKPRDARESDEHAGSSVINTDAQPGSRASRRQAAEAAAVEMERFRVEVGAEHGVKPENIVGAIANEAGLDSEFIGKIIINADHSYVELPSGIPKFLLKDLKRVWVCNRKLDISRLNESGSAAQAATTQPKSKPPRKRKSLVMAESANGHVESTSQPKQAKEKRKKKERHRDKKNKGKPS